MEDAAFLAPLKAYLEAFAEHDPVRRTALLAQSLTPEAEILGPKRVFCGYVEISEKIDGFHKNWPNSRLVLASGLNTFKNAARIGSAIVDSDGMVLASGQSIIELGPDGRICRVLPFWDALPPLPACWPVHLGVSAQNR